MWILGFRWCNGWCLVATFITFWLDFKKCRSVGFFGFCLFLRVV